MSLGATIPEKIRYRVFTLLVGVILVGLLVYLLTVNRLAEHQVIALSLVLGGGFGNLIDRICNQGRVVDYMNLGIGSLRTDVFNVADIAITLGVAWFLIDFVKYGRQGTITF